MLLQLEQECLEVYRRKVDSANHARARLHQALASAEAEFSALFSALGEPTLSQRVSGSIASFSRICSHIIKLHMYSCLPWVVSFVEQDTAINARVVIL